MISCLTVTREGKLPELERAIRCFDYQSLSKRELLIVHDATDAFDEAVGILVHQFPRSRIRVVRAPPGLSLGALRNLSVARAEYEIVCQWDDDDINHPQRLEAQFEELHRTQSDVCFFTDQLHYFEQSGELYWDDWTVERFPMNLIQGTLMGRKEKLGTYPDLARGEDTPLVLDLVRRGCRIVQLKGRGYLYIYVYNGRNAWDYQHHAAISEWKRLSKDRLLQHEAELREHLPAYDLPGMFARMPHEGGALEVSLFRDHSPA